MIPVTKAVLTNKILLKEAKLFAKNSTISCSHSAVKSLGTNIENSDSLDSPSRAKVWGYAENRLVANYHYYRKHKNLLFTDKQKLWRSGVKHDCSKIMELYFNSNGQLTNNLGEIVDIEDTLLYPMLKSSGLSKGDNPKKMMVVTQQKVGENTAQIEDKTPKTWEYLMRHQNLLNNRKSSIYRKQPKFSVFGVGPYTFSKWKVAISGFYKTLNFRAIGPYKGKEVVFDDTAYLLSCSSKKQAIELAKALNSEIAQEFFKAYIFWDTKRPITTKLLNSLDLTKLLKAKLLS